MEKQTKEQMKEQSNKRNGLIKEKT